MATDMWDSEEGYFNQGGLIGYVTLGTAVVAGDPVKFGTSAANQVVMSMYATEGDSCGIALKGGVTGDKISVLMWGVAKQYTYNNTTINAGDVVQNAGTAGASPTWGNIVGLASISAGQLAAAAVAMKALCATGTRVRLGTALQSSQGASGDAILVLVGKLP